MPSRHWNDEFDEEFDDDWPRYAESVPLPAEGGLVTSKRRGAMADTWWSRRFVDVLESYGLGGRMQRGRRYARSGQVLSLDVRTGVIAARVQGSRRTPYVVTISLRPSSGPQWRAIESAIAAKIGFIARLLAGELPADLEGVFDAARVALFPRTWRDVRADCSCPDWENPCKHIAAVLYVFADQLEADAWLLLRWRGRTRDQLLEPLRGSVAGEGAADEIAPWWPFASGPLPPLTGEPPASDTQFMDPDRADAVLDQLEELDLLMGGASFRDVIRAAYDELSRADSGEAVDARILPS